MNNRKNNHRRDRSGWGVLGVIPLVGAIICLLVSPAPDIPTGQDDTTAEAAITTTAATSPTPEPEPEPYTEPVATTAENTEPEVVQLSFMFTSEDVELIGRTIWGEAGGVASKAERAAVAWCILNRADLWHQSIKEVVTAPAQFQGYRPEGDCPREHLDLAADVLTRWEAEHQGATEVGRVIPREYLFFMGDGERNHFTTEWLGTDCWGWTLPDPYNQ